jgi:hypothetical protein
MSEDKADLLSDSGSEESADQEGSEEEVGAPGKPALTQ